MPRVVPEYREEAKARILKAAEQVFAKKGYHQATMDDIAKTIGVSRGAVYQYFRNKEELFEERCKTHARDLEKTLHSTFTGGDLLRVAELFFNELEQRTAGRTELLEALAEAPRNKAIKKVLQESYSRNQDIIVRFLEKLEEERTLRRNLDTTLIARLLMAMADGILMSMLRGLDESEARKVWIEGLRFVALAIVGKRIGQANK